MTADNAGDIPDFGELIERDAEVRAVVDALHDRGACYVAGPAGVGKTRILREVEHRLSESFDVLSLNGVESTSAIPLAPLMRLATPHAGGGGSALIAELYRRSKVSPVAVLVDDAHLVDEASAAIIRQMATVESVVVAVTVRTSEPVPVGIASIPSDGLGPVITLRPLGHEATLRLISATLGTVERSAAEFLWNQSQGLPLFVKELILSAVESGALIERDGVWWLDGPIAWGDRLSSLIHARLGTLSASGREALDLVVAGRSAPYLAVERVVGTQATSELLNRQMIEVRKGRCLPAHPLYSEVPAVTDRERLSELMTDLADEIQGTEDDSVAVTVLRVKAGAQPDLATCQRAVTLALEAGQALLAERLTRAGLAIEETASQHLDLAIALGMQLRWVEADRHFDRALELATEEQHPSFYDRWIRANFNFQPDLPRAIEWARTAMTEFGGIDTTALEHLELRSRMFLDDLGEVHPALHDLLLRTDPDSIVGRRIRLDIATSANHLAHIRESLDVTSVLLEEGPEVLGSVEWARVVAIHRYAVAWATSTRDALDLIENDIRISVDNDDPYLQVLSLAYLGLVNSEVGIAEPAVRALYEAIRVQTYAQVGRHVPLIIGELANALSVLEGRESEAEEWLRQGWSLPKEGQWLPGSVLWLAQSRMDRFHDDDPRPSLRAGIKHAKARTGLSHELMLLRELVLLDSGLSEAARMRDIADIAECGLAEIFANEAEATVTRDASGLDRVAAEADRFGAVGIAADAAAGASHLHHADGDLRSALSSWQQASLLYRRIPGQRSIPRSRLRSLLSEREQQVVDAVLDGSSSREAAERLYISHRTVDSHLRRIYQRFGISGREELRDLMTVGE